EAQSKLDFSTGSDNKVGKFPAKIQKILCLSNFNNEAWEAGGRSIECCNLVIGFVPALFRLHRRGQPEGDWSRAKKDEVQEPQCSRVVHLFLEQTTKPTGDCQDQ